MMLKELSPDRVPQRGPVTARWVRVGPAGGVIALSVATAVAGCVGQVDLFHDEVAAPLEPSSPPADGMGGGVPMAPSEGVDPIQSPPEAPPGASAPPSPPAAMDPDPADSAAAAEVPDPDAAPEPPEPEPVPPEPEADPTGGARVCPAPAAPELLDFESTNDDASRAIFGDFESVLSGGTFVYPDAASPGSTDSAEAPISFAEPAPGLSSDVSDGDWHISGVVAGPAGFGLFFDCEQLDASRFVGLAFRLQGALPEPETLTFIVSSAANEVSRSWLLGTGSASPSASFGRCTPLETAFDGSCLGARITLPVEREGDELLVRFADLAGGSPEPRLNPAEITSIQWALPLPSTGAGGASVPYTVDLRLDDIRFVDAE
jgi:hypothetical protein